MPHDPITVFGESIQFPTASEFESANPAKQLKYLYLANRATEQANELEGGGKFVNASAGGIHTNNGAITTIGQHEDLFLQNLGTTPLFVRKGSDAAASNSNFHYILAPGQANDDGTGAAQLFDDYAGQISVWSSAPRYTFHKSS